MVLYLEPNREQLKQFWSDIDHNFVLKYKKHMLYYLNCLGNTNILSRDFIKAQYREN